jgi:hypothetical protein
MHKSCHALLALTFFAIVGACSKTEAERNPPAPSAADVEAAKRCYSQSNSAALSLLQDYEAIPSAENVVVKRRGYENICVAEASCMNIKDDYRGMYLLKCLERHENNN